MATSAEGTSGSELNCSMNGYTKMVDDIMSLLLTFITFGISLIGAVLPPDIAKAVKLVYRFVKSSTSWMGFLVAAVYYIGLDLGYGELLCDLSQYNFIVIYWLTYVAELTFLELFLPYTIEIPDWF